MISGIATLNLGDQPEQTLEAGDAVSIRAGLARQWQNLTEERTEILVVTAR